MKPEGGVGRGVRHLGALTNKLMSTRQKRREKIDHLSPLLFLSLSLSFISIYCTNTCCCGHVGGLSRAVDGSTTSLPVPAASAAKKADCRIARTFTRTELFL